MRSCDPLSHGGVEHVRRHHRKHGRGSDRIAVRGCVHQGRRDRSLSRTAKSIGPDLDLFLTVLFIGVLLGIPGQSFRVLGAELIALAVLSSTVLYVLDRRANADTTRPALGRVLDAVAPNAVTSVLLLSSALVLVSGAHAGLYVLIAPVLVALLGGVTSTWLLLIRTTR